MNDAEANFQEDYHYKMKITVLGDSKSGKTTFIDSNNSTIKNLFNENDLYSVVK